MLHFMLPDCEKTFATFFGQLPPLSALSCRSCRFTVFSADLVQLCVVSVCVFMLILLSLLRVVAFITSRFRGKPALFQACSSVEKSLQHYFPDGLPQRVRSSRSRKKNNSLQHMKLCTQTFTHTQACVTL